MDKNEHEAADREKPQRRRRATVGERSSTDYVRSVSRLLPCFETLASLAPQHEVVVFQRVRPHPEEVTKWPSRRMGRNTDL
jgi:hypothetical protein